MIAHFDDFGLQICVLVDDVCQELIGHLRRPGPKPACSDSEMIAICPVGECLGWDVETDVKRGGYPPLSFLPLPCHALPHQAEPRSAPPCQAVPGRAWPGRGFPA